MSGLRERKKQQTRQTIVDTAHRLFGERGFDAVTVAEVAREADVSEGTVFNYFPTKEDLFYGGLESFEERLVDAVRERATGESALAAFRRFVLVGTKRLEADEVADVIVSATGILTASGALQAREHEIVARFTEELGALLAEETGRAPDDAEPRAAAAALMGVQRAVVGHVRAAAVAGTRGRKLATSARKQAERAFARVEQGLGDYAAKPPEQA
jgi:AcrR family transcriptional regulator